MAIGYGAALPRVTRDGPEGNLSSLLAQLGMAQGPMPASGGIAGGTPFDPGAAAPVQAPTDPTASLTAKTANDAQSGLKAAVPIAAGGPLSDEDFAAKIRAQETARWGEGNPKVEEQVNYFLGKRHSGESSKWATGDPGKTMDDYWLMRSQVGYDPFNPTGRGPSSNGLMPSLYQSQIGTGAQASNLSPLLKGDALGRIQQALKGITSKSNVNLDQLIAQLGANRG